VALDRPAEAGPHLEHALRIAEGTDQPAGPLTAALLFQLAAAMQDSDAAREAIPLLKRAADINEAIHGPEHAGVMTSLRALSVAMSYSGLHSDAIAVLQRILACDGCELGELGDSLPRTLSWLAAEQAKAGDQAAELATRERIAQLADPHSAS
jgi:hypothetical protein